MDEPSAGCPIQKHLQLMFELLRPEETLKMAVKLETAKIGRTRYLVVVSRPGKPQHHLTDMPTDSVSTHAQCNRLSSTSTVSSSILSSSSQSSSTLMSTLSNPSKPCMSIISSSSYIAMNNCTTVMSSSTRSGFNKIADKSSATTTMTTNTSIFNTSVTGSSKSNNFKRFSNCDDQPQSQQQNDNILKHFSTLNVLSGNSGVKHPQLIASFCDYEESCILGIDCNESTTVGLVLRVLADTTIHLDGDGGFTVTVCGRTHIFKPVSVQAMWSALQTLHKVSAKARDNNFYSCGPSHEWVSYYEYRIKSERSCLNEWNAMDSIESRRPPSPDTIRIKPTQVEETESVIRAALKGIMMSVDLDEVTSKYIRSRLEDKLDMDLGEFKSFIDEEMLIILGQMDAPTEIFDHVYLGSEWNASNLEELQKNGVRHILNVTREIDNFFPGMFDYLNVRVYDDEKTNLLKHWDNTFKYISRARKEGSKVLVHCKMGVSRSASVVIAYAMKAYNWNFGQALKHVKHKRNCIKPNKAFITQLETYQGMLDAMKNKEKLQRSKSETNLRNVKDARLLPGSEPTPLIQALNAANKMQSLNVNTLKINRERPKSWSPDSVETTVLLPKQQSQSLENLLSSDRHEEKTKNVLLPCRNGQNYSVSQNQVVHLQENSVAVNVPSVRLIVSEFESNGKRQKSGREMSTSQIVLASHDNVGVTESRMSTSSPPFPTIKKAIWDPGEQRRLNETSHTFDTRKLRTRSFVSTKYTSNTLPTTNTTKSFKCDSPRTWTSSTKVIHQASVINSLNESLKSNSSSTTSLGKSLSAATMFSEKRNLSSSLVNTRNNTAHLQRNGRSIDGFSAQSQRSGGREVYDRPRPRSFASISSSVPESIIDLKDERSANIVKPTDSSRQSSWSSVDSAIVVGRTPSRNSSWGSADTRTTGTTSRNSSWSSYDVCTSNTNVVFPSSTVRKNSDEALDQKIVLEQRRIFPYDKDEIPWHPGKVK